MQDFKEIAYKFFYEANYDDALLNFSLALDVEPENYDIKVGVLLSDYAYEDENDAIALLDFYHSSVALGDEKIEVYKSILNSIDYSNDLVYDITQSFDNILLSMENGVEYSDFIKIANLRGNVKQALEDIMFSAKLIIQSKEDMMNFIDLLMQYNFKEEALSYLEKAIMIYPRDGYFQVRFKQLSS
ncbi:MAG TPA: hypothetical protein EYG69_01120 [Campylobacterales bacterium]|nr:hypothetical protein [Campylobacterales bacterium]